MYDSIIHHLCIVLCIRHTESCLTIGVYPCPSHSITLSCLPHPQVPLIMTTLMVCVRALGDLFVLLNPWKGKIGFFWGGVVFLISYFFLASVLVLSAKNILLASV